MRHQDTFTLLELLVVIAIIMILAAMLLPVMGQIRGYAKTQQCIGIERQMTAMCLLFLDERGGLPDVDHGYETRQVSTNVWNNSPLSDYGLRKLVISGGYPLPNPSYGSYDGVYCPLTSPVSLYSSYTLNY